MTATAVPWLMRDPHPRMEPTEMILDLGGHTLRLAEIDRSRFPARLLRADEWCWAPHPARAAWDAGQAGAALRELVAQRHWPRRACCVVTRCAELQAAMLRLPPLPLSGIRDAIVHRLSGLVPFPLRDAELAFELQRRPDDGGWQIAAVIAARSFVREVHAAVESAGLWVAGLSAADAAYAHLVSRLPAAPGGCAILDIGAANISISPARRDSQSDGWHVLPQRRLSWGSAQLSAAYCRPVLAGRETFQLTAVAAQRLKHAVGIPRADDRLPIAPGVSGRHLWANLSDWVCALADDAFQTIREAECESGVPIERLYLAGGGGALRGLDAALGERLNLPVEVLEPRCVVRADATVLGPGWSAIAAHALARVNATRQYNEHKGAA